ncbi:hypothetical protein DV515_00002527 [Chloebia gouldiae]|uniref:Uncharacterized protein n=1 Tax=Chloebia gouldiae TaxID=44316 RepID=A0A3L8SWC1_CHLGU|nr:hypothetical protein DV515_00002527 [Chloebia gouldiae]
MSRAEEPRAGGAAPGQALSCSSCSFNSCQLMTEVFCPALLSTSFHSSSSPRIMKAEMPPML